MEAVALHLGLVPDLPLPESVEPWVANNGYKSAKWGTISIVIGPDLADRDRSISGDTSAVLTYCASVVLDAGMENKNIAAAAWQIAPWLRCAAGR